MAETGVELHLFSAFNPAINVYCVQMKFKIKAKEIYKLKCIHKLNVDNCMFHTNILL